jgi:sulfur carrier protein
MRNQLVPWNGSFSRLVFRIFSHSTKDPFKMKIIVNGKEQHVIVADIALLDLIKQNKVQQPDMVSVQLNDTFVKRENFEITVIRDGDRVDFLYFMGGGDRGGLI